MMNALTETKSMKSEFQRNVPKGRSDHQATNAELDIKPFASKSFITGEQHAEELNLMRQHSLMVYKLVVRNLTRPPEELPQARRESARLLARIEKQTAKLRASHLSH